MIGEILGNCRVTRVLGEGGSSVVYEAVHCQLNSKRAIKVFKSPESPVILRDGAIDKFLANKKRSLDRFLLEAKITSSFSHPNLVTIHNVDIHGDTPYIEMEFVEGIDLQEFVRTNGPIPVPMAVAITAKVSDALTHVFNSEVEIDGVKYSGVVHRDIKPSNLILTPSGDIKIFDFGIAKVSTTDMALTQEGKILGTPQYVPLEALCSEEPLSFYSDDYSLACTLYFLIAGVPAFNQKSIGAITESKIKNSYIPISAVAKDIPTEVESIIHRAMSNEISKRYKKPGDMAAELYKVLNSYNIEVTSEISTWIQNPKSYSKDLFYKKPVPWSLIVSLGAAVAIILFIVINSVYYRSNGPLLAKQKLKESHPENKTSTADVKTVPGQNAVQPNKLELQKTLGQKTLNRISVKNSSTKSVLSKNTLAKNALPNNSKAKLLSIINGSGSSTLQYLDTTKNTDSYVTLAKARMAISSGNHILGFQLVNKVLSQGSTTLVAKDELLSEASYWKTLLIEYRNKNKGEVAQSISAWKEYLSNYAHTKFSSLAQRRLDALEEEL
jgi:serine/threonine protein kinase